MRKFNRRHNRKKFNKTATTTTNLHQQIIQNEMIMIDDDSNTSSSSSSTSSSSLSISTESSNDSNHQISATTTTITNIGLIQIEKLLKRLDNKLKQQQQQSKINNNYYYYLNYLNNYLKCQRFSNILFMQKEQSQIQQMEQNGIKMKLKILNVHSNDEYEKIILIKTEVISNNCDDIDNNDGDIIIKEGKNILLKNGEKIFLIYSHQQQQQQLSELFAICNVGKIIELYPDWFIHCFQQQHQQQQQQLQGEQHDFLQNFNTSLLSEINYYIFSPFNVLILDE